MQPRLTPARPQPPNAFESLPTELVLDLVDRYLDLQDHGRFMRSGRAIHALQPLLGRDFAQAGTVHQAWEALFSAPDGDRAAPVADAAATQFLDRHAADILQGLAARRAGLARKAWLRTAVAVLEAPAAGAVSPPLISHRERVFEAAVADLRRTPPGPGHDRKAQKLTGLLHDWPAHGAAAAAAAQPDWLTGQIAALLPCLRAASLPVARHGAERLMARVAVPICRLPHGPGRPAEVLLRALVAELSAWPDRQAARAGLLACRARLQQLPHAAGLQTILQDALAPAEPRADR